MGRIQDALLCVAILVIVSSCYSPTYGYLSTTEREYYFIGGQPYDITSSAPASQNLNTEIAALFTDRGYYLDLHYHGGATPTDRYVIRNGTAFCTPHRLSPEQSDWSAFSFGAEWYGEASIIGLDVDLAVPVLETDSELKDMVLHGTFLREPAQALINEVRAAPGVFAQSQGQVVANWSLTGTIDEQPFSVSFKQDLTGARYSYSTNI